MHTRVASSHLFWSVPTARFACFLLLEMSTAAPATTAQSPPTAADPPKEAATPASTEPAPAAATTAPAAAETKPTEPKPAEAASPAAEPKPTEAKPSAATTAPAKKSDSPAGSKPTGSPTQKSTHASPYAGSPTVLMHTHASSAPREPASVRVAPPEKVQKVAKLSAMDRAKIEHRTKVEGARAGKKHAGFGSGLKREINLRKGEAPADCVVPTEMRSRQHELSVERKRNAHAERVRDVRVPAATVINAAPSAPNASTWAKSRTDRYGFQRSRLPHSATAVPSAAPMAPGPGAYGKSRSFVDPHNNAVVEVPTAKQRTSPPATASAPPAQQTPASAPAPAPTPAPATPAAAAAPAATAASTPAAPAPAAASS